MSEEALYLQGKRVTRQELWDLVSDGVSAVNDAHGGDRELVRAFSPSMDLWLNDVQQYTRREERAYAIRNATQQKTRALEALEELQEALAAVVVYTPDGGVITSADVFHHSLDFVLKLIEVYVS